VWFSGQAEKSLFPEKKKIPGRVRTQDSIIKPETLSHWTREAPQLLLQLLSIHFDFETKINENFLNFH